MKSDRMQIKTESKLATPLLNSRVVRSKRIVVVATKRRCSSATVLSSPVICQSYQLTARVRHLLTYWECR